jgi:hypothetical protein
LARPSIIRVNQPGAAGVAARATAGVPEDVCYYEDNYKVRSDPLAMHVHLTCLVLDTHSNATVRVCLCVSVCRS